MKRDIPSPHTLLLSYHYAEGWDLARIPDDLKIVGDSGAYSARMNGAVIRIDDLGAWAAKWRHRLFWVAALDVAGNQRMTRSNWETMNREYRLQSIPSIHYGDDPRMIDYYVERGCDFIGLGGTAGGSATHRAKMRWLIRVFKYQQATHPQVRFHGWGMTGQETMRLPFWSVDSSSWCAGFRYGSVLLRDPRTGDPLMYRANGRDAYAEPYASLLTDHYGISPAAVATSTADTRPDIVKVSALSQMAYEQKMKRLHRPGITPPTWGLMHTGGHDLTGPISVLAESSSPNLVTLSRMVEEQ